MTPRTLEITLTSGRQIRVETRQDIYLAMEQGATVIGHTPEGETLGINSRNIETYRVIT